MDYTGRKGKEIKKRDKPIDESKYTELVSEFKGTYFEEVYNTLKKHFKLGRVRILLKEPRSTLVGTGPRAKTAYPNNNK